MKKRQHKVMVEIIMTMAATTMKVVAIMKKAAKTMAAIAEVAIFPIKQ